MRDHFGNRRNMAGRWQQGGDDTKIDASARRSSRAQRRMDRAEAKCVAFLHCSQGWLRAEALLNLQISDSIRADCLDRRALGDA